MPGWAGSTRRDRLPADWHTTRRRIIERDHGVCQHPLTQGWICGAPATDVDHIHPGDDHSDHNLWALCRWHHLRKTAVETNTTRLRPSERHPDEPHPGMVS